MAGKRTAIFVMAEQCDNGIQSVSLQLVGKARQLADILACRVGAVFLGHDLRNNARKLVAAGADQVFQGDSTALVPYQAELYSEIMVKIMVEHRPEILLLGSTFMGRELAPLIAAKLGTGLTAHCIDLTINSAGILEQRIPAYGGLITIVCPEKRPQMATVANGVFSDPKIDSTRSGEIIPVKVPDDFPLRARTVEIVREEREGVALDTATTIVAGGAGAGDAEGWAVIAELAQVLKAGLASTRPAVDAGWAELETMIGQSGKMVSPQIYIGVGVSGEQQHMVGVVGAQVMIAINNDVNAPVFKQVDYGVVEDCRVFVPALVEKLRNAQTHSDGSTHGI